MQRPTDTLGPRPSSVSAELNHDEPYVLIERRTKVPRMPKRRAIYLISDFPRFDEPRWSPMADVYRTRTGWILKFDLAGVRPEDIRVRAEGCRITVSGTRRDSFLQEEGYSCYSMEISYNRFERTIELPCDGILLVRVTH
jgi:HSP20 family protein